VIAVQTGLLVLLALQVRTMRPQVEELRLIKAFPFVSQWVPTVRMAGLTGDSVTVGETLAGRTQTLIFFTASCPYCLENLPRWKALADTIAADSVQRDVYWISLSSPDSTAAYVAKHGIRGRVLFPTDAKMQWVFRVKGVPMTLVLNHRGQVLHARPSVLRSSLSIDSILFAARNPAAILPRRAKQNVSAISAER
jgi:hypothetical protein